MSKRVTVVVWLTHPEVACFRFSDGDRRELERLVPDLDVKVCADQASFLQALTTAEIAVVWVFRQEWFSLAPKLRWLATPAAGRDYFRVTPPPAIHLSYGRFHGELIAETILGMMLGTVRGIVDAVRVQARDPWPRTALAARIRPLRGAHLVILGLGSIGTWVARLAKPFGVRVTGFRRGPAPLPPFLAAPDRILAVTELDQVLPSADHLVLTLPGSPETDRILDARRLALLPAHAVVYNAGRGNSIDEDALAAALHGGRLGGACIDVHATEPLPAEAPLRKSPRTLLLPHVSAVGPNYMRLFVSEFAAAYRAASRPD